MNIFKVKFLSPDNEIVFEKVVSVLINGLDGEIMILSQHSPYLIYLLPGIIKIKICDNYNKEEKKIVTSTGILEVAINNCNIISNKIQVFNSLIHNEESLKNERMNLTLKLF